MSKYAYKCLINQSKSVDFLEKGYTILSTGGTFKHIYDYENVRESLIQVSDYTGFQNIGRVKTLHPKIWRSSRDVLY